MIDGKSVLAVIPARGGSKGLPGKNLRLLCGKPLVAWSIEKAKKSLYMDVVLLTTDSPGIADVGKQFGATIPFLRPENLATDEASTYDVIRHALTYYREVGKREFYYVVLLEPTSPLREDDDVDRMLEKLHNSAATHDSVVSVGEVSQHPSIMKRIKGDQMESFCPQLQQTTRRQDNDPAYFPFGVAYIAKTSALLEENTFYTRRCLPFLLKRYQNFEIDDLYDFLCIENVMKYEWKLA